MKWTSLFLSFGVLVTGVVSCATPPPPPPVATGPGGPAPRACTTSDLLSRVSFLKIPFNPQVNFSPTPDENLVVDGYFYNNFKDAYEIAPQRFKNQLCDLSYIFIDPSGCAQPKTCALSDDQVVTHSWGLRGYQDGDTGKYIATSSALWQNGGSAPVLSEYETRRLRTLLPKLSQNAVHWNYKPDYASTPDTPGLAVLASLAHEFGHVFWYDAFVSQRGGQVDKLDSFCKEQNNKYKRCYPPGSWRKSILLPPPSGKRWIDFGETRNTHNPDYITNLTSDMDDGNFDLSAEDIHLILQSPNLVSILAAFSPDEDFVETEQLKVISDSNTLSSFVLRIYDTAKNVI